MIIFDVGLFHSLWGIHGCVAQHLDGGYGRFAWCLCHIGALVVCLPCAFMRRPKPYFLWPLLIQVRRFVSFPWAHHGKAKNNAAKEFGSLCASFCLVFTLLNSLFQQSAYGIGLLILSLAALPRILPTFMGDLSNAPMGAILAYLVGTLMNFFLVSPGSFAFLHLFTYLRSV